MPEDEPRQPHSEFVASITIRILRHAARYADEAQPFLAHRAGPPTEQELLDSFNIHVESVLASFDPPGIRRRGDSLVFAHIYDDAKDVPVRTEEDAAVEQLAALLAAEVEFRGPLRLSRTQATLLAEVYERLGDALTALGLHAHTVLSLRRAAFLHRQNEELDAADRCGLRLARARCLTRPRGWHRVGPRLSDLLCGYGYQPFRLLAWIAAQLILFAVVILLFADGPVGETLYLSITSYLNPTGLGDTASLGEGGRAMLAVESWAGTVSLSVFFALLVRRWFRL
ncbi:hypothetical protein [Nocardia sp. NPDC052566]|uniref:hypothetical protein n=1 Tax=Nocardia sp. NPDC052566 TaxID=3364330 RepID=UPI0037CBD5EA